METEFVELRSLKIAVCLAFFTNVIMLQSSLAGSPIRLEHMGGETGKSGVRYSTATIRLVNTRSIGGQFDVSSTIRFPGQFMQRDGHFLVTNRKGTIGALTFQPATKTNVTFLLLAPSEKVLLVLADFNERIRNLIARTRKAVNPQDIIVNRIDSDVVTITSVEYNDSEYRIRVRISSTGAMRLVSYKSKRL